MIINSDITLYNKCYDKVSCCNKYKKTYLRGVNYKVSDGVTTVGKGVSTKNEVVIYIPFNVDVDNKSYLKPKAYDALDDLDKEKHFTLNNGDIIVKGIIDFELITGQSNNFKKLNELYDDVCIVSNIITYDCGSDYLKHWKVVCN